MKTIPDLLKKNQELIDKAVVDYELIEEFYYSISQDDFNAKYEKKQYWNFYDSVICNLCSTISVHVAQ